MDEQAPDIALDGVTKRFGDTLAVDDLTLAVPKGSFFALLGPSGCGKTTTLRMIGGFEDPTTGRISLAGRDVTGVPPYKRDVNTVFQSYALFPHLTIERNVAFGLQQRRVPKAEIRTRVAEALELVQLHGLGGRKPAQLSGGQQQRVALARALVNRPRALLLDEPLGALDLKLRKQLQLELSRIQREVGITFVHVTHDQDEAMSMADTIAVMNEGRIEQMGSPEELYERPRTAFVARFLGACNLLDGDLVGRERSERVGVRPEKMRLAPAGEAPQDGVHVVRGQVTDASFLGVLTEYVVRTGDGTELLVVAQNDGTVDLQTLGPGREVDVFWKPEHSFTLEKEPAHA